MIAGVPPGLMRSNSGQLVRLRRARRAKISNNDYTSCETFFIGAVSIFLVIALYIEHVKAIGIAHLKRMTEAGEPFTLLDVRARSDYDREHIKGARSLPLDEIEGKARAMLKPDEDLIVYCDSFVCSASTSASKMLSRMGFKNVRDYKGGLREWKQAGLPTESNYQ